ncbi:ATP-binding cassette domain-containing protein [Acidocella aminolytica]|uniref:ABC transporter branched-chain amino acid permease n=1 Tax=Acidocella aminolytica 101 = DSM 11237 TaxID=1120923 RepID=A0A0D6PCC0_9PROT|nr:ATP-binding cassette domain-containing protein [Acidocella aminolytica]GAN78848.1 ABC transporter branched-chain amino acid permease [Acidocella aminolytica 101 = DSM 11237]GBQ33223.1 branched-chain amino acid ABC transporter ATP-binding protein [Acidocella aminolytica 101 = DSM 11237]SHF17199.1 branched-chain amino acid transport system ATP-binding protein [Acidocella aminolytica 101 = DSM 11237]
MSLLHIENLKACHGLLVALHDLSFSMEPGEVLGIVGANGAGKSTLMRSIAGAHRPAQGRIMFRGQDVTRLSAHRRVRGGIALVPEGRRLFPGINVQDTLRLAACRKGIWNFDSVLEVLPQLKPILKRQAGLLSGGQQQAVAIGRALMTNPELLLLDELSLGLSPVAVEGVYEALPKLRQAGTTIILVEQDLRRAMASVTRLICMLEGRIVLSGAAGTLTREAVMDAYFGLNRQTH